jgi:thermostable 8-oxoguanine DNA glycosylase
MITEEIAPTLETLHAEILELKRSVAELRAMIPVAQPTLAREVVATQQPGISFEDASQYVRSNYSHLLQKLSQ